VLLWSRDFKKILPLLASLVKVLPLAKLLCYQHNLLILDEPTNHLDINSKEILKKALIKYSGTLIVVSHDRDFLDGLVDKLYEFKNGKINEYTGSITEFLNTKILEAQ
jgi:ATP-binding cassette subfamily F protein 3